MTTPVTPRASWDDGRLETAFAARASSTAFPTDLIDATVAQIRAADRPDRAWRRWLPAAAVVLLAIGVAAGVRPSGERPDPGLSRPDPTSAVATRTPDPSPTDTAPRLADLRVMTVEELIAAAWSPTPEEVVVHGWLGRSNATFDCNVDPNPHPLIAHCEDFGLTLSDERVSVDRGAIRPSVPHVVPVLEVDAHVEVAARPGSAIEVQAIGHLLDHRWTTCPEAAQAECKARFVIDRVLPAGTPLDDGRPVPWAGPPDLPVGAWDEPIAALTSLVGSVTVVSMGVADANTLRSIEPLVQEINNEDGARVIRALVAGDSMPVARTFLMSHIGFWTVFEVTESGVVDRIARPDSGWPPEGVLDVPMPEGPNGIAPEAGVVDRTGLLLEARAAPRGPNRSVSPGKMSVVQFGPDSVVVHWDGTCGGGFVLTLYGDGPDQPPDGLEVRGDRATRCRQGIAHYGMVLRFSQPVDAAAIDAWDRIGTPFGAFPPADSTVVALPNDGGGFDFPKVRAALVDLSGRIKAVRLPETDEIHRIDGPSSGGVLVPDPSAPGRYHLAWIGGPCAPDIVITIDPTLSHVVVTNTVPLDPPDCDTIAQVYRLVLDIDGPLDPPAVEVRHADMRAGAS